MLSAKLGYYQLIAVSLIMATSSYAVMKFGQLSEWVLFFTVLLGIFFAVFVFLFTINFGRRAGRKSLVAMNAAFVLFIASFIAGALGNGPMVLGILGTSAAFLEMFGSSFVYFFLFFFCIFFSAFFIKVVKNKKVGVFFFLLGVLFLWIFFLSGWIGVSFKLNDETALAVTAVNATLHGVDPYTTSIYSYLYSNEKSLGITILTTNNIASVMDYPALYFLSYVPFWILEKPNLADLSSVNLNPYLVVSLLILTAVIVFSLKEENLKKPIFGLLIAIVLGITYLASIVTLLALAILILAYVKIDKGYAGLLMGIGFSIHQQIWIPLIFLMVYSLNNYGYKKFGRDAALAIGVFLLINGYFIVQNPSAFLGNVLLPAGSSIFPDSYAPLGYFILNSYGVPLGIFSLLPIISLAALVLVFVYFNDIRLVGLFSLVPLMFLQRGLYVYYTFFILLIILSLFLESKATKKNILKKLIVPNMKALLALLGLVVVVALAALYLAHQSYVSNFNLSVTNQSLIFSQAANSSVYTSTIDYGAVNNRTEYVYVLAYAAGTVFEYGLFNNSLIANPNECAAGNGRCLFNVNKIVLNGSNSSNFYKLQLDLGDIDVLESNVSRNGTVNGNITKVYHPYMISVAIYNNGNYYTATPYYNATIESENPGG